MMNAQANPLLANQTGTVKRETGRDKKLSSGMRVLTGLQAGAYRCRDCSGTINGTQMSQASCNLCQLA